ncbi:MAG TPA: LysR family transcriptional regulator [Pseudonocardia sp.]|nr:LysR family transcriptional regulator [Pseudonocardia sp.]
MRLEVRHLEVLLAIEESSSISGAARKLGIDQPHVTRQLRRIEQRLGVEVFVRTAKGVTATSAGVRVLSLARRALGVIDELSTPESGSARPRETLRVLYYGLPAIAILDDLGVQYPELQVRFSTTTPAEAYEQLRAGTADVFLGIWLPHVEWPASGPLATREILADPTYVYLAADHPLAAQPELRLTDLAGENWVTGVDRDSWTMVREECRLVGGFEPLLTHRVADESTVSTLVGRGRGVALGSSVASRRPAVVGRPYQGSSPARWMQAYAPGRVDRDLVATVSGLLRARHVSWSESLRSEPTAEHATVGVTGGVTGEDRGRPV